MSNFVFDKENPEFLAVLEAVALEKGLKKDVINKAVESALETALMEYFTGLYDVSVKIKSNGAVSAFKKVKVVENVSDIYREISLDEAKVFDKDSTLGAEILMPLSVSGFSSHIIRNIGFLINKEMIKREKEAEFNYFQKLKGFIISGVVKKVYFGGLLIVMDKYEAFLAKNQMLPTEFEKVRPGDRLEALVYEVERNDAKPQAVLTRTSEEFLYELLKQAIPEIMDETIQIKAIARDAGSKSKVAVFSKDPTIKPDLVFISTYGRQIRRISKDLCGERIDIIEWNEDPAIFLMNALNKSIEDQRRAEHQRKSFNKRLGEEKDDDFKEIDSKDAELMKVVNIMVDYENKNLDVVMNEKGISFAIGRKGQNVRLLTKLLGWSIHFITKEESSQKKFEEISSKANTLVSELNIDEMVAQLLVIEKLDTVEKIAKASIEEIASIEGFDEEIAESILERALHTNEEKKKADVEKHAQQEKKADKLAKDLGITLEVALQFITAGIENKSMIAELSVDEVVEDYKLTSLDANLISNIIMKARGFA